MNAMTTALPALSNLSPAVAIHLTAAVLATALGPVALWARRSQAQRPRLHRAAGYAWVTLMVLAALSALFISGSRGPRVAGFGPIHLLVPFALGTIVLSFRYLLQGNLSGHRRTTRTLVHQKHHIELASDFRKHLLAFAFGIPSPTQ